MCEKDLAQNADSPNTGTPEGRSDDLYMDSLMEQIRSDIEGIRSHKKANSVKKWILRFAVLPLFLVILLLVSRGFGVSQDSQENTIPSSAYIVPGALFPDIGDAKDGTLAGMTPEEMEEQMQKEADEAYFSYKINSRIVFENGSSEGNIGIENPNYNVYPMVVRIYLGEDDTGELIYDSGGILPNQHIDNAKLGKVLEAGEYKAIAYLYAYDPETKANIFKATAELTVIMNH